VEDVFKLATTDIEGVKSVNVQVRPHSLYGSAATINVDAAPGVDKGALEDTLRQTFGQYAVHYELVIS
jgi:hypothetical protein